jgi:hypothetical protein
LVPDCAILRRSFSPTAAYPSGYENQRTSTQPEILRASIDLFLNGQVTCRKRTAIEAEQAGEIWGQRWVDRHAEQSSEGVDAR